MEVNRGEVLHGVVYVVSAADFADGVHGKLRGSDVHGANAGSGGENWPNGGTATGVASHDELLHGNARALANLAEHECRHGIGGVTLVGVVLDD